MPQTSVDQHISELYQNGYTVFREILPPSLISDLRCECDKAVAIARAERGAQAQRIQPIGKYADQIDLTPFENYRDLPELNDLLHQVLTPEHTYGDLDRIGVLLEPQAEPWCTNWHRDWRDHIPLACFEDEFEDDWMRDSTNMHKMLQINCPLYEDHSTWFVPDSHIRQKNTEIEEQVRDAREDLDLDALRSSAAREKACLDYVRSMPNAVQLCLNAGDFALYRPCGWHLGNYVPYKKRATLHDSPFAGDIIAFVNDRSERLQQSKERLGLS